MEEPVLECHAGEVGGEFLDEKIPEVGMFANAEECPYIRVGQCCEGSNLEFKEVVLCRAVSWISMWYPNVSFALSSGKKETYFKSTAWMRFGFSNA
jgi:hypothetical protein